MSYKYLDGKNVEKGNVVERIPLADNPFPHGLHVVEMIHPINYRNNYK